jgi:nicotinate-nucleotide adenylyltransferase
MAKIGIFGGTFDPFHQGHLKIAVEAAKKLDKVIIVPTICDYYRPDSRKLFTFDEKVTIINQMISNAPGNIWVDSLEKDKDSKWRTINTVEEFKKLYPNDELYLIIGEDSYKNFPTWFRYEDILLMATLMVVQRGNNNREDLVKNIPCEELYIGKDFLEASSSKVRNKLISELMDMYLGDADWYNKL